MKQLYIVSLGPGDHELISIKALKTLLKSDAILISAQGDVKDTKGFLIIKKLFCDREYNAENIKMPPIIKLGTSMRNKKDEWQNQACSIISSFNDKKKILSYITIGDAAIYSTAYYLLEILKEKAYDIYEDTKVIPGISSFSAASALVKKPLCLGKTSLLVTPWFGQSSNGSDEKLTRVFMKPHSRSKGRSINGVSLNKVSASSIKDTKKLFYFEKVSLEEEKLIEGELPKDPPYLSLSVSF